MAFHHFHPKAYLTTKRNVSKGLRSRTKIIETLEKHSTQIKKIAKETGLSYRSIVYHLQTLSKEKTVETLGTKRPQTWKLTHLGQQRL